MLNFDSLDPDAAHSNRSDDYSIKPARTVISRRKVFVGCCVFLVALLLVGLLCGLLGQGKASSCHSSNIEPTRRSTETTVLVTSSGKSPSSTTPASTSHPWDNPRLPGDLRPSHYDLEILIDVDDRQRFRGNASVTMNCTASTDVIMLHAKELEIIEGTAHLERVSAGGGAAAVPGLLREPWTHAENQYVVVQLDGPLVAGATYRFTIGFEAPLVDGGLDGLYRSSYNTAKGGTKYLAVTFFAPTNARMAFPCFDEPAMKASFNITVIHQPSYFALSNMPLIGVENVTVPDYAGAGGGGDDDGALWVRSVFEQTPRISTYIVCYVVCDFKRETLTTANNVTFTVWAREAAMGSVRYALENGVKMLDFYDSYFGIKFPLPKMDMIAIPDFSAGAMENWGLITYRESALLYTVNQSSASNLQRISVVMGHELAHQWFGNLVSFEWWNDLWLKEGFASYMEYIGSNVTEPDWAMSDQFVVTDFYSALQADALATSRPIIVDVETADDINQQYDAIAYDKGSSIIRMISSFLGTDVFRRGLEIYLTTYQYSNAMNTDLWNCFTQAAEEHDVTGVDVKEIMDTWTLQMGYPTVFVTREYSTDNPSFTANQSRFLINPDSNLTSGYSDLGYTWHVPLLYITKSDYLDKAWLQPNATAIVPLPGQADEDWLLMNENSYGYYRVNYDPHNWKLLIAQLHNNHRAIPVSNRAALISDAFNLAQAGDLVYTTALNLSLYLHEERDYVPWRAAQRALDYINIMLSRSAAYGSFQKYIVSLVSPFYQTVDWDDHNSDHLQQLGSVVAINQACSYGNKACVTMATSLFRVWMNSSSGNPIPANQKWSVYCTAIAEGGQKEWFFAFAQYESTIVASERALLLDALACSRLPWILNHFLRLTLDRIKSQDVVSVVTNVAKNPVGYDLAWDFFKINWGFFRNAYGSSLFQFPKLIAGVTAHFTTESHLRELLAFMSEHPDQGTGERALSKAVEQTRANIRWTASSMPEIAAWLEWANY